MTQAKTKSFSPLICGDFINLFINLLVIWNYATIECVLFETFINVWTGIGIQFKLILGPVISPDGYDNISIDSFL